MTVTVPMATGVAIAARLKPGTIALRQVPVVAWMQLATWYVTAEMVVSAVLKAVMMPMRQVAMGVVVRATSKAATIARLLGQVVASIKTVMPHATTAEIATSAPAKRVMTATQQVAMDVVCHAPSKADITVQEQVLVVAALMKTAIMGVTTVGMATRIPERGATMAITTLVMDVARYVLSKADTIARESPQPPVAKTKIQITNVITVETVTATALRVRLIV